MRNNHQSRNVVLTGFMGSGKSTVGGLLAGILVKEFVDTDTMIEQIHGPIPEIFKREGEEAFRQYEREISEQLEFKENKWECKVFKNNCLEKEGEKKEEEKKEEENNYTKIIPKKISTSTKVLSKDLHYVKLDDLYGK